MKIQGFRIRKEVLIILMLLGGIIFFLCLPKKIPLDLTLTGTYSSDLKQYGEQSRYSITIDHKNVFYLYDHYGQEELLVHGIINSDGEQFSVQIPDNPDSLVLGIHHENLIVIVYQNQMLLFTKNGKIPVIYGSPPPTVE